MADVVSQQKRSRMMAAIRGKDTKPEMEIRKALHRQGFRFRLHNRKLPGKPDLTLPRYKAVIFVQGCFWHRHDCHLFKWPGTRIDFWKEKINANAKRDQENIAALVESGWRVLEIWECALKGKHRLKLDEVISFTTSWLLSDCQYASVSSKETGEEADGRGTNGTLQT